MAAKLKHLLLASLAVTLTGSFEIGAARADSTAAEIAMLKAELRRLEARVAAQDKQVQQTRTVVQTVAGRQIYTKGPLPVLASLCPPDKFCYKGITITPGGFFEMGTVLRDHNAAADLGFPFGNIPFKNNRAQHNAELRFSARQSRLSLLVEGNATPNLKLSGYGEFDFLGAAQTANSNESNSYTPRIRHLYLEADQTDLGIHVLAGQTWSLATMFATGLETRKENIPIVIDPQQTVGQIWTRQPQIRIVKDITPDFHVGVSVENPATTEYGNVPGTGTGFVYNQAAVGGGLFNGANNISLNHVPDVVAKAAYDTNIFGHKLHLEGYGVGRDFYGRFNGRTEDEFTGFGGGSVLLNVLPKLLDVQFTGAFGDGIGRYGASQLPDITVSSTGQIHPIEQTNLLAGATLHATPQLDIYAYAGQEQQQRTSLGTVGGVAYGTGNPALNNATCLIEGSANCPNGANGGNTQRTREGTVGAWYDFYKGPYGQLRAGAQYSYTERKLFSTTVGGSPTASENTLLTSIRYYPF